MLPEDLRQLLLVFNEYGVEYLVVGGYAVGAYAEPRATKDLDLLIRSESKNSLAVFQALAAYGAPLTGLSPADFQDHPESVFQIGQPPARVDILQRIDGIAFEDAWKERTEAVVSGIQMHVISAKHLIQNKLTSGRMRDLADVEALREAARESHEQNDID